MTIEIDGGQGEGGGQIVRTAIALSTALGSEIHIRNIRKGRSSPGLRPQHLAGISLAGEMCDAQIDGLEIGSTEIRYSPGVNTGGQYKKDIGTAGSVSLLLQSCIIPALFAKSDTIFEIRGGTDVPFSPPMDYLCYVIAPFLRRMGADIDIEVHQRGFYPAGGGHVAVGISPVGELAGLTINDRGRLRQITGSIVTRNLPPHVAERMKNSATKGLAGYQSPKIDMDIGKGHSTGASIVLSGIFDNTTIASSALGEKGVPAEKIGESAARFLVEELKQDSTLDDHATDQLIPFLFLANGGSEFVASELSLHARTNISIVKLFVDRKIEISEKDRNTIVSIE